MLAQPPEPVQAGVGMEPSHRDEAGPTAQPASEVQRFTPHLGQLLL